MSTSFWTILGIITGVLSLGVNYLQLRKNNELKKKITIYQQQIGDNSKAIQQTHSGDGHNINAEGNVDIK